MMETLYIVRTALSLMLLVDGGVTQQPSVEVTLRPSTGVVGGTQEFVCAIDMPYTVPFTAIVWKKPASGEIVFTQTPTSAIVGPNYEHRIDAIYDSHLVVPENGNPGESWLRINATNLCDEATYRCQGYFDLGLIESEDIKDLPFQDPNVAVIVNGDAITSGTNNCVPLSSVNISDPATVVVTVTQATADPTVDLSIKDSKGNDIDPGTSNDEATSDPDTCAFRKESTYTVTFPEELEYTLTTTLTVAGTPLTLQDWCFTFPSVTPPVPATPENPPIPQPPTTSRKRTGPQQKKDVKLTNPTLSKDEVMPDP